MIIDSTYFDKGILFIPNNKDLNAEPIGTPTAKTDLELLIELCERQILLNALGVENYEQLKLAIDDLPNADQKWRDLINGITYTDDNGIKVIWNGLVGYQKMSLLACFVYCEYLRNKEQLLTTTGVVKNNSANADNVSATPKFIKVWNIFLNQYQGQYSENPKVLTNGFGEIGLDYSQGNNREVSLYQYLQSHKTDFADFRFKFYENFNSFGI